MMTERQGIRIRTSLCFNNNLKKFTLSVFQLEGLQEYEEGFPYVYVKVTRSKTSTFGLTYCQIEILQIRKKQNIKIKGQHIYCTKASSTFEANNVHN